MAGIFGFLSILDGLGNLQPIRDWDESGTGNGPFALAHLDAGPAWPTSWGVSNAPFASADQHSAAASVTDVPTTGQFIVVDEIVVSVDTTMNITFQEETSANKIFGPYFVLANTTVQLRLRSKRKLITANKRLQVITSVAGHITVDAAYHSEA